MVFNRIPWNKGLKGVQKSHRKGISLEEEYGKEKAEIIRQKIADASKGRVMSKEMRDKMSKSRKGKCFTVMTEEIKKKISEAKKGFNCWTRFKNPEETKKKLSIAFKGRKLSPEWIKKMSKSLKGRKVWNKGLTKQTDERIRKSDELRRATRIRDGTYIAWNKGITSQIDKRIPYKERHGNWMGGISFEPYTSDFDDMFKEQIKERDNLACQLCNLSEEDSVLLCKRGLVVHHIDYNKKNSFPQNCVTLCNRCNVLVNKDREIWTKHFQELLKKLHNYEYTEDQKIILDFIKHQEVKQNGMENGF